MNVQAGNSAFCFLTCTPKPETLEFARELAQDALQYNVDVFIMIDFNNVNLSDINASPNIQLLQIPNEQCFKHNYRNTIWLGGSRVVTAWDKALLYFNLINKNYSFVWLSEDDVFFPSVQSFRSLHELYSNTSDFIVPSIELNLLGDASYWHWGWANGNFFPPWAHAMVNVIGLSQRMLIAVDNHVQWLGRVPFHEFLFNIIAMHLNYTIVAPPELTTDVWLASYSFEDIRRRPHNLYHPLKNLTIQKLWRQRFVF